ncbi:MAG: hypothetical protein GX940_00230 [Clostridiaceae bacterium]|jgi:hypothetical protein|nr:hypothetical protein [Clostridiaceae bacterium]
MGRELKERLKTILIIVLIITGLLQIGILWSYQNQGSPFSFLLPLFSKEIQVSNESIREKLFVPNRLVVSNGENDYWIISENQDFHGKFFSEVVAGLSKIATGSTQLSVSDEKWESIVTRRGIIVDFGFSMEPDLLGWFLGTGSPVQDIPRFSKLMVRRDIVREDMGTIYIRSADGTVYSTDQVRFEQAANLSNVINRLEEGSRNKYRRYKTLSGSRLNKAEDEPDILYVVASPRYWPYKVLSANLPAEADDEETLARAILGEEEGRYNKYTYNGDMIQYTYGSNIYRYYSDGYLTYRYLGSADTGGAKASEALMNTYKFIARANGPQGPGTEIVLSSVERKVGGIYEFCFDYRVDGLAVITEYMKKDGSGEKQDHAIRILADSKRVLECDWLIRNFKIERTRNYNDRLLELLANENILWRDINISGIDTGYYIRSNEDRTLEPALIVSTREGRRVYLDMIAEEGD